MEKAKYLPEEIDRIIAEEISRIDAANSAAALKRRERARRTPLERFLNFFRARFKSDTLPTT